MYEFVMRGGQAITTGEMEEFARKVPFLKAKAETLDPPWYPHLRRQALFLARYAEDVLEGAYSCGDLQAITETVFGLRYLMKEVDIIPDSVPDLGLADDSAVLRAILSTHQEEFRTFAEASQIDFEEVTSEA